MMSRRIVALGFWGVIAVMSGAASQAATASAEGKGSAHVETPWYQRMQFKGDLMFRHEYIGQPHHAPVNAQEIEAFFGVVAEVSDTVLAEIRLATGVSTKEPSSSSAELGDAFAHKSLGLDLGYIAWIPVEGQDVLFFAGKMKNPFYTPAGSQLIWDEQNTPEGLATSISGDLHGVVPFINLGGFWLESRHESPQDAWLIGTQLGAKLPLGTSKSSFKLGWSYYNFTGINGQYLIHDKDNSYGNSTVTLPADGGGNTLGYKNDYNVLEAFGVLTLDGGGFPFSFVFDFARNLAVETERNAWLAGLVLGEISDESSFKFWYNFRRVEKDAVFGLLSHSDFRGGGTNGFGHELGFEVGLAHHVVFGTRYFADTTALTGAPNFHKVQIDLEVGF